MALHHSCKLLTAPSTPSSAPHFLHDQQLTVVDIATAGSASFQSAQYADHNTDVLVRVDLTSSPAVACTDACRHAPALPCIDHAKARVQARMLACVDNLQAKGQLRSCIPAVDNEETRPACVYAHSPHARNMQRHCDQYSNAEEEVYLRVQSCLPPMSSTLIECIERARARLTRYTHMWAMMQLMSTVSQIMGVLLVLGLCSKEEVVVRTRSLNETMRAAPLRAWAVGYALGCLASLPVLCKHSQWTASNIDHDLVDVEEHTTISTHELNIRSMLAGTEEGRGAAEAASEAGQRRQRLRQSVDLFFGIWFVLGVVWVFGRPSCAQANPKLYSLCVTLLMLSGLRYMMPLILCCALCCCLQPTTSIISSGFDQYGARKKGATQEQIDATLAIFKFKHRRFITNNVHNGTFPISTTSIFKQNICKDGMEYCCICLETYKEEARLRGLPCSHYFHVDCVDKWLKINASCPLCKFSIKENKFCPLPFF